MNFTQQQYLTIRALAEGIFPHLPDSPGASELPVAEMFITIAQNWEPQVFQSTANALNIIDDISLSFFGLPIAQLDAHSLAIITDVVANNADLKPFWGPFRMLIALNYYALPPAYEAVGLPGPSIDNGGFTADGYPA